VKILQIHNRYRRAGGEDAVVQAEGDLLRDAGYDVLTYGDENPPDWRRAAARLMRAPWNARAAEAVVKAAAEFRPDVVHVHNTWFSLSPSVIAGLNQAGYPVVMTLHNYRLICANASLFRDGRPCETCIGSHPWHGVIHRCYNESALTSIPAAATISYNRRQETWSRDVSLFFVLTSFGRDRFVAGGLPAERLRVKPHFVPDPGLRTRPPSESRSILYAGRLVREKGLHTLLEAFADAPEKYRLLVAGDGSDLADLQRRAGDRVHFLGMLNPHEVRALMLDARALVFPSLTYETFGLVLIEAMAAGLPVVASDLGGSPDIVGQAAGIMASPGDVDSWRDALRRLDGPTVDALGVAARTRWAKLFSPQAALPALVDGYSWAIDHGPVGTGEDTRDET
jgi:glycosyltransferase involved in cell wall biosynthesis